MSLGKGTYYLDISLGNILTPWKKQSSLENYVLKLWSKYTRTGFKKVRSKYFSMTLKRVSVNYCCITNKPQRPKKEKKTFSAIQ